MAGKGYIGKISAIVTVNTADAQRAFNKSAADATRFGQSLKRTVEQATRDAGKSFENIFTPLQRLQRSIQASRSNSFNLGIKGLEAENLNKIEQLTLAARQLASPLGAAAKQFDGLSFSVQRQFSPALERVTTELLQLRDRIQEGGTVGRSEFSNLAREIDNVTASTQRLAEASALTKKLLTVRGGGGLQFSRPEAFDAVNAAADAQRGLASLPAAQRGSQQVRDLIEGAQTAALQIEKISARIERLQSQRLNVSVSQAGLDEAVRRLDEIRARTEAISAASEDAARRAQAASRFLNVNQQESALLSNQGASTNVADRVRRLAAQEEELQRLATEREQTAIRLQVANGRLAIATDQNAIFDNEGASTNVADRVRRLAAQEEQLQRLAEERERTALRLSIANSRLAISEEQNALAFNQGVSSPLPRADLQDNLRRSARDSIGASAGTAQRQLGQLRSEVVAVRSEIDRLPASLSQDLIPNIQRAEREFINLASAPDLSVAAIERARTRLQSLTIEARQASEAFNFRQSFGSEQAIGSNIQRQQVQGYTAQIQILQGELASLSNQARGPAVAAISRLGAAIADAMDRGELETRQTREQVQQLTSDAVRAVAAARGISPRTLGRVVARAGDVGRQGFGNFGLAVQQAAFIVDDFFSVTGGLDQRIRAIGNNISQLGFILGGTTGLIAGVAASVTSQLVVALIKWSNQNVETQDTINALNDTLARQKRLVDDLASAYDAVASSIERVGFSRQTQDLRERNRLVDDLREKQRAELRERIGGLSQEVQRERAFQAARQRELEAASDPGERVRLTRELRQSRDRERAAIDRAVARPAASPTQAVEATAQARFRVREAEINTAARAAAANSPSAAAQQRIEQQRLRDIEQARRESEDFRRRNEAVVNGTRDPREQVRRANEIIDRQQQEIQKSITTGIAGAFDGANAERRRQLAALEEARAQLEKDIFRAATNEVAAEATKTAIDVSARIGKAQELLASSLEGGASDVGAALDRANQSLLDAEQRLKSANETGNVIAAEAARRQIEQIDAEVKARESAASNLAQFADVVKRISTSLAETVASEARNSADQARRDANAGAAGERLGFVRPEERAFLDRRRERLEQQAREAEDRRDRVRRQNDARRLVFEQQAGAGNFGEELRRAIRERDEAIRFLESGQGTAADRTAAENRRARAQATIDRSFEDSAAGRAARDAADRADRNAQIARQQEESIQRGRQLLQTPAQRAADEVAQNLYDLQNAVDETVQSILDAANGLPDAADWAQIRDIQAQGAEAASRAMSDAARSTAPAIAAIFDEVQNAVLQGPSRAALDAVDASTTEGSKELNRLLRGDDAARNANIVELEKQNQSLIKVIAELQKIAAKMGMTLDLK